MWKKSPSFPQLEIGNDGTVLSWHGSWERYVFKEFRKDKDGYNTVGIRKENGKGTTARVHRLVAEAFIPNPDNKPLVNHVNGIKDDNRVSNLRWSTVAENTQHAYDYLGVLSAMSIPVELRIDNEHFSDYQSVTRLSELMGINRNAFKNIENLSNGYFTIVERPQSSKNPQNKNMWREGFKINLRGNFYKFDGNYFDKIEDIVKLTNREGSTIYRWIKEGHPKGKEIKIISCEEYLRNTPYRNW